MTYKKTETITKNLNVLRPDQIKAGLDKYVIGQEEAKITLSVAAYNHYMRVQEDLVDFETLSAPFSEEYRKKWEAENKRSKLEIQFQQHAIGVRDGLYRALLNNFDEEIESLRDDYMVLRKLFYKKLGEEADDRILEKEWTTFLNGVEKDVLDDQRQMASRTDRS